VQNAQHSVILFQTKLNQVKSSFIPRNTLPISCITDQFFPSNLISNDLFAKIYFEIQFRKIKSTILLNQRHFKRPTLQYFLAANTNIFDFGEVLANN